MIGPRSRVRSVGGEPFIFTRRGVLAAAFFFATRRFAAGARFAVRFFAGLFFRAVFFAVPRFRAAFFTAFFADFFACLRTRAFFAARLRTAVMGTLRARAR